MNYDEALKDLEDLEQQVSENNLFRTQYSEFDKIKSFLNYAKKQLEAPTSDEVCEALSKYIKRPIEYYDKGNQFVIRCSNGYHEIARLHSNNEITFDTTYCLPPHLITLIGRFYEKELEK